MHLLITSSGDVTSDLICERLSNNVLRVNWERWQEYDIEIHDSGFWIADKFGREISDTTLDNIIWRKPVFEVPTEPGEVWYCFQEFKNAVQSIISWVRRENPCKIPIDPHYNTTIDKFYQLRVASRYLQVSPWAFTSQPSSKNWKSKNWIIKSVTGKPITGTGTPAKVIYTSAVNPEELDDGWTWFIQEKVDNDYDLTVVYLDGQQYGFVLDRNLLNGLDWRQAIGTPLVDSSWEKVELPVELSTNIDYFMRDLGLRFGRLDLMTKDKNCQNTTFLEVNPNGQWAWLDLSGNNGLFEAVINFLTT